MAGGGNAEIAVFGRILLPRTKALLINILFWAVRLRYSQQSLIKGDITLYNVHHCQKFSLMPVFWNIQPVLVEGQDSGHIGRVREGQLDKKVLI